MLSMLLDTNVYGRMVEDKDDGLKVAESLAEDPEVVVRNFRLIRNELRRAPAILPIYDQVVSSKVVDETHEIRKLANTYFEEYKNHGGHQGRNAFMNDMMIVACATLAQCDIVVSDDQRTLGHPIARSAYATVNLKQALRTPSFLTYSDLKKRYT